MTLFPDILNREAWVEYGGSSWSHDTQVPTFGLARMARAVEREFGATLRELQGPRRLRRIARPRQVLCWLALGTGDYTVSQIGRFLNRDHSTVSHAERQVIILRDFIPDFKIATDKLWYAFVVCGEEGKGGL